jgi:hypothetical protein
VRIWILSLVAGAALLTGACSRGNDQASQNRGRGDTVAEKAGRAAYKATEKTKAAAKQAAKELKKAGNEAREGWNEAKREAQQKKQ